MPDYLNSNSFFSALVGGLLALTGSLVAAYLSNISDNKKKKLIEISFLESISCELEVLKALFQSSHEDILERKFGEDGYFEFFFVKGANYFQFFDANMEKIEMISNKEIRLLVHEIILHGKVYLDSVSGHGELLTDYMVRVEKHFFSKSEIDSAFKEQKLEALVSFDVMLAELAKDTMTKMEDLQLKIDKFLTKRA